MRHVMLTCCNHPDLRWHCKEIAFSEGGGYNGCRNIFFAGFKLDKPGTWPYSIQRAPGEFAEECKCPPEDLIRAPEDKEGA